jgi:hypothetical protein
MGFLLAVTLYVGGFFLDQHLRSRRGPWEVTFQREPSGEPSLLIRQPSLGISNLVLVLSGEPATNAAPATIRFDTPTPERVLPFGALVHEDLTYLPGTITLNCAGHEIELLPRTLYLNRKPVAWKPADRLVLHPSDKLPPTAGPRKKSRY